MGIIDLISDVGESIYNARGRSKEYSKVVSKIRNEANEMLQDNRVARLLADVDDAYSQSTVAHISILNFNRYDQYDNALFIYYVQPQPEPEKVKWSKPTPPKTIPPVQLNFSDYDLYFSEDEACSLLYVIFCRYSRQKPRYGEEYDGKPPFRWTFHSMEDGAKYYANSQYTGDCEDSIGKLSHVLGKICFPASRKK